MDKYTWLVRRQQKALGVFEAAKKDLERVVNAIETEVMSVHARISNHKAAIFSEENALTFLGNHKAAIEKQTAKIAALLE